MLCPGCSTRENEVGIMKISEYDAFGPWIYQIDEEHEIPKFFRSFVDENDGALCRFKVPKKIERRDANPDMDLYEYLFNVYNDRLEVMQLTEEGGMKLHKIAYDKVTAVTALRELLLGSLTVYFDNDSFTFEYNAVSQEIIMEVIASIRNGYKKSISAVDAGAKAYDPSQVPLNDLFFINEWVRIEPVERPFVHCAFQPMHVMSAAENSSLMGSLHMKKEQEWIILRRLGQYSYEYIYLPRTASTQINTAAGSEYPGINKLMITAGNYSTDVLYDADNKEIFDHYRD